MREINSTETDYASGGVIKIGRNGQVTSSAGKTTITSRSVEIKTNDGWTYQRDLRNGSWSVTNATGRLVNDWLTHLLSS